MLAEAKVQEYLDEIRREVCNICVERPPGGPPCLPLGKNCGIELHLPELIAAVREVHSIDMTPYLEHNRGAICASCQFLHSSQCPCPMDYLLLPIVEAVEKVDARSGGRQPQARELAGTPAPHDSWIAIIRRAFAEGHNTWTGCDWPTKFGKSEVDLRGWSAEDAESMVTEAFGLPGADDWPGAALWLARIEKLAEEAEDSATAAVVAAEAGNWLKAVELARHAWLLEVGSGRLRWHGFPLSWQPLRLAVEAAARAHGFVKLTPVLGQAARPAAN